MKEERKKTTLRRGRGKQHEGGAEENNMKEEWRKTTRRRGRGR